MSLLTGIVFCAAVGSTVSAGWTEIPPGNEEFEVHLTGSLVVSGHRMVLCKSHLGESPHTIDDRCIDVVPAESFQLAAKSMKCAVVFGNFRRYSGEFVGLGNLTSTVGLVVVRDATSCDGR